MMRAKHEKCQPSPLGSRGNHRCREPPPRPSRCSGRASGSAFGRWRSRRSIGRIGRMIGEPGSAPVRRRLSDGDRKTGRPCSAVSVPRVTRATPWDFHGNPVTPPGQAGNGSAWRHPLGFGGWRVRSKPGNGWSRSENRADNVCHALARLYTRPAAHALGGIWTTEPTGTITTM